MNEKKIFQTIRQLGFSDYEARCYLAMFNKDSMAVSEVAKLSGVPRPNTYDALEKLMNKGFIKALPGKTKRYAVSDPRLIKEKSYLPMINSIEYELEGLDKKVKEKAAIKASLEENMEGTLECLDSLYRQNRENSAPIEFIEVMKDARQINDTFIQLIKESKTEILSLAKQRITNLKPETLKTLDEQVKLGTGLIKKGLSVKCIYEIAGDEKHDKDLRKYIIDKFDKAGEQIRVIKDLPMRVTIFDEKVAMYTLVDDRGYTITASHFTQVVRNPVMAKSLKIMFDAIWDKAEDYKEYKNRLNIKK